LSIRRSAIKNIVIAQVCQSLDLVLGFDYEVSQMGHKDRSSDLPLNCQIHLGTGLQYDWNEDLTLGAAYAYIDASKLRLARWGITPRRIKSGFQN
jgi:long-subunit fatty acid transport protein